MSWKTLKLKSFLPFVAAIFMSQIGLFAPAAHAYGEEMFAPYAGTPFYMNGMNVYGAQTGQNPWAAYDQWREAVATGIAWDGTQPMGPGTYIPPLGMDALVDRQNFDQFWAATAH